MAYKGIKLFNRRRSERGHSHADSACRALDALVL